MTALEFALDPRDQEKYGGPEWVVFDAEAFDDLPWSVSGPWDRELVAATGGRGVARLIVDGLASGTADGITALIWLSRMMAGIDTPAFVQFDIRWRKHRKRAVRQVVDVDPPASGSSEPRSEDAP